MPFKITKRDTGEIQLVSSTEGYNPEEWDFEKLKRVRGYQEIDPETGKLRDHRKAIPKKIVGMTEDDLRTLIKDILREEGVV